MVVTATQPTMAITRSSEPRVRTLWRGSSPSIPRSTGSTRTMTASPARPGKPGELRICLRLIDKATNTKPVSAANAPVCAVKKGFQSVITIGHLVGVGRLVGEG